MHISYTSDEHDPHMVEACFYEPGEVAVLSSGQRCVSVNVNGRCEAVNDETGASLSTTSEFRSAFPDGIIDSSEWQWARRGSFTLMLLESVDGDWVDLDGEYDTLDEAMDMAIEELA